MIKNILFLDVDGVLNSEINRRIKKESSKSLSAYHIQLPGDKLFKLKRIIIATNAKIVLSSSWRLGGTSYDPSYAQLNLEKQLNNYGMSIYDITPSSKDRNRGVEIYLWLNNFYMKNGYIPRYVILDNVIHDLIDYHKGHIVKIPELIGIQDKHVSITINLFKRQQEV